MSVESWSAWKSLRISMRGDRFHVLIGWTASQLKLRRESKNVKALKMEVLICTWLLISVALNIELFSRYCLSAIYKIYLFLDNLSNYFWHCAHAASIFVALVFFVWVWMQFFADYLLLICWKFVKVWLHLEKSEDLKSCTKVNKLKGQKNKLVANKLCMVLLVSSSLCFSGLNHCEFVFLLFFIFCFWFLLFDLFIYFL